MTNSLTTKFASALIAVCATTASFAEVTHAETLKFQYDQRELNSAEGTARINGRVESFARNACRSSNPLQTPAYRKQCREEVAAQLRGKIFPAGKREPVK